MTYDEWFTSHAKKHKDIVEKLLSKGYDQTKIIEYFRWENIKKTDEDFCPLFADNKKCHDMEDLNCYFCGCPHFRYDDDAYICKSTCSINSKNGKQVESEGVIHQDCSNCLLPHKERIVNKYFDTDWVKIMSECKS